MVSHLTSFSFMSKVRKMRDNQVKLKECSIVLEGNSRPVKYRHLLLLKRQVHESSDIRKTEVRSSSYATFRGSRSDSHFSDSSSLLKYSIGLKYI